MTRPFLLGLTGSIGMGKSTTAEMFEHEAVPVWGADAAVHRLYVAGGAAVGPLKSLLPGAVRAGAIDRNRLRALIDADPALLGRIEAIVHPLVARDRARFIEAAEAAGAPLVVLDIPLLFETGTEREMDAVVVVTVPEEVQRARVMAREGMTEARFRAILARQMPDAEKRARAEHVIETMSRTSARDSVRALLRKLRLEVR